MNVLVTGGAGYIGSHVARQLVEAGHEIVVLDNLSTGYEWAALGAELVRGDCGDATLLDSLFAAKRFDAVLHFAASIVVPESVSEPLKYYANNTANALKLVEAMRAHKVRDLVFSSTAAVYGHTGNGVVSEESPTEPASPYGASKLMSERIIQDCAAAYGFRAVLLRYFNVAGADPQARIGQATPNATHLIKVACETVLGFRPKMQVYGTDYGTPDGTCIRDYIHVEDLACAHVQALDYLHNGGETVILNCGYGHGYSVKEVIGSIHRVSGVPFKVESGPRRLGDVPKLVARNERIRRVLGWKAEFDDLDTIVAHALAWERKWLRMRGSGSKA
jgi:UDP-glucose 4-epimerase